MDNIIAAMLNELTETAGWKVIEDYIDTHTATALDKLKTVNPSDVVKITQYQQTIRELSGLVNWIDKTKNEK